MHLLLQKVELWQELSFDQDYPAGGGEFWDGCVPFFLRPGKTVKNYLRFLTGTIQEGGETDKLLFRGTLDPKLCRGW